MSDDENEMDKPSNKEPEPGNVDDNKDTKVEIEPEGGIPKATNAETDKSTEVSKPKAEYQNPAFDDTEPPLEPNGQSYNVKRDLEASTPHDEIPEDENFLARLVLKVQTFLDSFWSKNKKFVKLVLLIAFLLLFYIYLIAALYLDFHKNTSWCHGSKFLLVITLLVHVGILYKYLVKKALKKILQIGFVQQIVKKIQYFWRFFIVKCVFYAVVLCAIVIFVIVDAIDDPKRLVSASGIIVIVVFSFIFSQNPSKVKWRPVIWGLFLQFIFALVILRWDFGQQLFTCIGDKVKTFLAFTDSGTSFLFNYLVTGELKNSKTLTLPKQFPVFAFYVLPVIIFFNVVTAILYYMGVMQVVIKKVGWLLNVTIGTTVAESMNAAANIFLGMTEAPLVIAPFMPKMTASELHSVMTGGFATIAGSIMAAYINFGISASHLLSASVMSAPAALGVSKLFYPETEKSETDVQNIQMVKCEDHNVLQAVSRGARQSISLIANIAVNLIAFLSIIAFIDSILIWIGGLIEIPGFSFELILSKIFVPLAFVMGVELDDVEDVARLIGLKTMVNEFVAYARLGEFIREGRISPRSEAIATYALCGFANIASIGIQIGALGTLAPSKRQVLVKVALRAMIAGSMACFLTACIAGTLIPSSELVKVVPISNSTNVLNATLNLI